MKKFRYVSSFIGLMALCVVLGMAFFIYCDSGNENGTKDRHKTIDVEIKVNATTMEISLNITIDDDATNSEIIEAYHNQDIEWFTEDSKVLDFVIFFGGDSPLGDLEIIDGEEVLKIYSELRPTADSMDETRKRVGAMVLHNPHQAGGRRSKYYLGVYYDDPDDEIAGTILLRDPEIIIPPRGGTGKRY